MNGGFVVPTHGNLAVVGSTATRDSPAVALFIINRSAGRTVVGRLDNCQFNI